MYPEGTPILLVDSDAKRREFGARVLAEEGFAVTAMSEGFSAIRAAGEGRFALAVAALRLPGTLDGPTTVRHIRARQPWLKALFIGQPAMRQAAPACDRDDFIADPYRRRELLGCVFELLQRGTRSRRGGSRAG